MRRVILTVILYVLLTATAFGQATVTAPIHGTPGYAPTARKPGDWTLSAAGLNQLIKHNLAAAVAPVVGDDSDDGYVVGSRWFDTTADKVYLCIDATVGAAVWREMVAQNLDATLRTMRENQPDVYAGRHVKLMSPYATKTGTYKGQLHCHSNNPPSDGVDTPTAVVAAYKAAGYHFVSLTDHNVITADPGVSGILFINGVEVTTTDTHHITFQDVDSLPSGSDRTVIDAAIAERTCCSIAHPTWTGTPWSVTQLDVTTGYDSMSVWNTLLSENDETTIDAVLRRYRRINLRAEDDCHGVGDPAGFDKGWVQVYADSCTTGNIMEGLRRGNYYSSNGPTITAITVSGRAITVTTDSTSTIVWTGMSGTLQTDASVFTGTYTAFGDEWYVRATVTRASDGRKAWTNPIYVEAAPTADLAKGGLIQGALSLTGHVSSGLTSDAEVNLYSLIGLWEDRGESLSWRMDVAGGSSNSVIARIRASSYIGPAASNMLHFYLGAWNNANTAGDPLMTLKTTGLFHNGQAARSISMDRHTTSNTAGNALTIQAGGATIAATNKSGGDLILSPGLSTGTATSGIQLRISPVGAAGTGDNTLTTMLDLRDTGATLRGYIPGTASSAVAAYYKNLVIGGTGYNALYNSGNAVMLHIGGYSNDGTDDVYPIYCEDENNEVSFSLRATRGAGVPTEMRVGGYIYAINQIAGDSLRVGTTNTYSISRRPADGYLTMQGTQGTYNGYDFLNDTAVSLLYINPSGNIGVKTSTPGGSGTAGAGAFSIGNGTAPVGGVANQVSLYSADVTAKSELFALNENGDVTQLSSANATHSATGFEIKTHVYSDALVTQTPNGDPGTVTIDWRTGNNQALVLTSATDVVDLIAFTNPTGPCHVTLEITQHAASQRTITAWDTDIKWAGDGSWSDVAIGKYKTVSFYFNGTRYTGAFTASTTP